MQSIPSSHTLIAGRFFFLNQPFSDLIVSLEGLKKGLSVLWRKTVSGENGRGTISFGSLYE